MLVLFISCQPEAPELSSEKTITTFSILAEDNPGLSSDVHATIDGVNIHCTLPAGTSVTALKPTIVHTGNSVSPSSGTTTNFSNKVNFTITAEDQSTTTYEVTVNVTPPVLSSNKTITSFSFLKADNPSLSENVLGIISGQNILCTIPSGVSVTALKPTILHTGISISPASGSAHDFTSNVSYSVTAEDGSRQDYNVSVSISEVGPIVYIAGSPAISGTSYITLWKNGTPKKITNGTYNSFTSSLFVSDNTAYVLGYQNIGNSWASYWMDNGVDVTAKELQASTNNYGTNAYSIYVSDDNDVYAAGAEIAGTAVWKNGVPTYLTPSGGGNAHSVFVSGSDVYVAGWVETATGRNATLWKNGVANTLSNESLRSEAHAVFVSNNNVYVAGLVYTELKTQLTVWKNGTREIISPDSPGAQAFSMFVSEGNVYLAGSEIVDNQWKAKVWKNGEGTILSNINLSHAQSIYVHNGDVYAAGWIPDDEGKNKAVFWKNGVLSVLPKDATATDTYAWSIVVK